MTFEELDRLLYLHRNCYIITIIPAPDDGTRMAIFCDACDEEIVAAEEYPSS